MIPIHVLGGLKSIPHSSRTSVYTFIMEVYPTPPHLRVYLQLVPNILFLSAKFQNFVKECLLQTDREAKNNIHFIFPIENMKSKR